MSHRFGFIPRRTSEVIGEDVEVIHAFMSQTSYEPLESRICLPAGQQDPRGLQILKLAYEQNQ